MYTFYILLSSSISKNKCTSSAVLGRLKPNKSPGGDGLHHRVLVELKNEMATPLIMIFTRSLHEGQPPPPWKEANVTPIYKKGTRHIQGNYRPVSLTSMAGKCMERLIRDAIMTHMTENDLLSPKQPGFIQGRSCVTQLLPVLDSWTLALDEGGNIDTIYIDFAKAFDTVSHQRLLTKLRGYGIEGRILTWIEAFLTDRRQRLVINDSRSSWADVTSGIPQGSVLGPMLFICYINDMPSSVQPSIYLFADDAKLYRNIAPDDDPHCTPARPSATGEMSRGMAAAFQGHAPQPPKPKPRLHHGRNNAGYNNQREGSWRVRGHRVNFRETHRDCCTPGEQNAWTHPSLVYLPRQPVTTESVYQSCQADARVCKCSMDSYPETRPNPTRECSATSNEADTRATRQRLRGPATRTETTEPILPKRTWRHDRSLQIHTQHIQTEQEPLQRESNTTTRGHSYKLKKERCKTRTRANFFGHDITNRWNNLWEDVVTAPSLNSFKSRLD